MIAIILASLIKFVMLTWIFKCKDSTFEVYSLKFWHLICTICLDSFQPLIMINTASLVVAQ